MEDIPAQARDRLHDAIEWERDNREEALHDLEVLSGHQWPDEIRKEREDTNRPCLTINRLPQFVRQVTGDIRRMNPAVNVMAGDQEASPEGAEIYEGLIREIQYRSDASNCYEAAGESAAACGMGYFRILTEYADEFSLDQQIKVERIHNPFSVYFDPKARLPTRADGDFVFVTEQMRRKAFEEQYPDASPVDMDVDAETDGLEHWADGDFVTVAEYIWKEPESYEIGVLASGQIVRMDQIPPGVQLNVLRKRKVKTHKVMWAKITGKEVLEGPQELPTKHLPVIAVMGEETYLGDRVARTSVIRFAKDPQQLYNYWRSAQTEMVALQPKAPYMVTVKQIAGLESLWQTANETNAPYLPYNPDEKSPPPQRATPPIPSAGMMQEVMTAAEDLMATTGVYDAGLGNKGNETSGVAIRQRQMESDVSTSIYSDNVAKAVEQAGRVMVDMIPRVYDANRVIRILGKDDVEKLVEVNSMQMTQDGPMPINDLTIGRYDVRVAIGPNYTTRRQEAAESMIEFVRAVPQAGQVAADLIAKNMDWPGAEDFADRLKKILPPGIREPDDMSPEEQQQMQAAMQAQQAQQQMAMQAAQIEMQKNAAEAQEAAAQATGAGHDAEKARFEVLNEQMDLAAKNGELQAIIQQEVLRALQMVAQPAPMGR